MWRRRWCAAQRRRLVELPALRQRDQFGLAQPYTQIGEGRRAGVGVSIRQRSHRAGARAVHDQVVERDGRIGPLHGLGEGGGALFQCVGQQEGLKDRAGLIQALRHAIEQGSSGINRELFPILIERVGIERRDNSPAPAPRHPGSRG